jgi:hypothetical protein
MNLHLPYKSFSAKSRDERFGFSWVAAEVEVAVFPFEFEQEKFKTVRISNRGDTINFIGNVLSNIKTIPN